MIVRLIALTLFAAGSSAALAEDPVATTAPAPKKMIDVGGPALGAAKTDSKVICKRDIEIGSWVKGVRRCGTKDEWKKSEEAARKWTADIQDQKGQMRTN